jgi:N-acetylneuraminate synthase
MEEVNLRAMQTLSQSFGLPVGYSDHTEGLLIPIAAVALGAEIIEKHFTLDRSLPGPDHEASLEAGELSKMVRDIRRTEVALGDGQKRTQPSEWNTRTAARHQIIASRNIVCGEFFSAYNLGTARAGSGESPFHIWDLYGTRALRDYSRNSPLDRGTY